MFSLYIYIFFIVKKTELCKWWCVPVVLTAEKLIQSRLLDKLKKKMVNSTSHRIGYILYVGLPCCTKSSTGMSSCLTLSSGIVRAIFDYFFRTTFIAAEMIFFVKYSNVLSQRTTNYLIYCTYFYKVFLF